MAGRVTWRGLGSGGAKRLTVAAWCVAWVLAWAGSTPCAAGTPAFVDVAASSNVIFTDDYGPVLGGVTAFAAIEMQRNMGEGAAVGDYDGDGDLDVYLLGQLGYANRLLRNNLEAGNKTFTDVTATAGVGNTGFSRVAHFVDLDNDGRLDLLLINDDDGSGNYPACGVFRNNGDGTFTDVTIGSGFAPTGFLRCGASLADYDLDGLLDVYVTVWSMTSGAATMFQGENRLYHNLGGFVFEDVTTAVGLGLVQDNTFTTIFTDFNGDSFPDMYVATDAGPDYFYWNNGGLSFAQASVTVGVTHTGNDMGVACGDFDDDGDLDIFTTNITDADGNFGFTQRNAFYVNQLETVGQTVFANEAVARGVEDTYWGWGTQFVDVENDGDLDIVAVDGFDEWVLLMAGASSSIYQAPSVLFLNDGVGHFSRQFGTALDQPADSRALIAFDYDRDGDEDLLVTNVAQPTQLLENQSTSLGHWLDVAVVQGPGGNRNGIGGTVYARIGGVSRRRDILCGVSYLAGTPAEAHFGLGSATTIDVLRVEWTDGSQSVFNNVAVDQFVHISNVAGDCNADAVVDATDVDGFVSALFGGPTGPLCTADMNGDGSIDGEDIGSFIGAVLAP